MKDFHDMLERYHRGGFYFEVKREQVVAGLFAVGIGLLIIKMAQIVI